MAAEHSQRQWVFTIGLYVIFLIMVFRILQLQIYSKDRYLKASELNRIRVIPQKATRGLILDKKNKVIVDNRPSFSVSIIPFEVSDKDTALSLLSSIVDIPVGQITQKIDNAKSTRFTPVKIASYIDTLQLARLEEHRLDLPGVIFGIEPHRYYPYGVFAPHVFGFLGEINSQELEALKNDGYLLGDIIGKRGLEKQYEHYLSGKKGTAYMEVDVYGRVVGALENTIPPEEGHSLNLTLDIDLQNFVEEQMAGVKGAAVMLDCNTGEILAIVSKPEFDLNLFTGTISPEVWHELVHHPDKPLYDRCIQGAFPPGSTFKLVLAAAAIEKNIISTEQKYSCSGSTRLGRRTFDCWKEGGHGELNFLEAIEQSCNVYFYILSLKVGVDIWAEFAKDFGFGALCDIDLSGESKGIVPDRNYLDKRYGNKGWTNGMLYNLGVGQGDLLVTPLQMAQFAMAIANDGLYYAPHLLKSVVNTKDNTETYISLNVKHTNIISKETFATIKEGMFRVVNAEHGTGRAAFIADMGVCGKTGTAQNPHGEDHAWFIGFAPNYAPQIAFCFFIENGGGGGAIAAPIAGRCLQYYFKEKERQYTRPMAAKNE